MQILCYIRFIFLHIFAYFAYFCIFFLHICISGLCFCVFQVFAYFCKWCIFIAAGICFTYFCILRLAPSPSQKPGQNRTIVKLQQLFELVEPEPGPGLDFSYSNRDNRVDRSRRRKQAAPPQRSQFTEI